ARTVSTRDIAFLKFTLIRAVFCPVAGAPAAARPGPLASGRHHSGRGPLMHTTRWLRLFAILVLGVVSSARLSAQGITTAAITGTIIDSATHEPVDAVQVSVVNQATGTVTTAQSRGSGVYFVAGLIVGGPYSVTIRRIGYRPDSKDAGMLNLGQRKGVDFSMIPPAATLAAGTGPSGTPLGPGLQPNPQGTPTPPHDTP